MDNVLPILLEKYFEKQNILFAKEFEMAKTAFIFPGQGAQYVGMGKDFYENLPVCRQVMEKATRFQD